MRVLLVEDEADLVEALRYALTRSGYAADVALNLREATARLELNSYDVVVLDLNLPDGDGLDLARDLRAGRFAVEGLGPLVAFPDPKP
jgi:DNA-binding response OmpR family regulator